MWNPRNCRVPAPRSWAAACLFSLFLCCAGAQVNVLTYHNDNRRTGQNLGETVLTPSNVNSNTFGKLFSYPVDGYIFGQPLYVAGVDIPGQGAHNVLFVATEHNTVYAFDADSNAGINGGLLWQTNLGPSAVTPTNDFGWRYGPYTDISPEVGITSTPLIDAGSGTIYLDAVTHEGPSNYVHRIHALNITNGMEQPYSPVQVTASVPGSGVDSSNGVESFRSIQQLQRTALTMAGGKVYVAFAGYGDTDPYHGWVIGFDAGTLVQETNYAFNDTPNSGTAAFGPNAGEGGIWMSGCGISVDENTNLYLITGNGSFDGTNGSPGTEFGDCFLRITTSNGLAAADFFAPFNQETLAATDEDLGSGGAVLLPDEAGSAAHPHLLVGCGKEGTIYLLDRDNLGHYNSGSNNVVQEIVGANNGTWSSPAYFDHHIYYSGSGEPGSEDSLKSFTISNAVLSTSALSQTKKVFGFPGLTPSVSADGTNNAIVWVLQTDGYDSGAPAILRAFDAYDIRNELYDSTQAGDRDQAGGAVKFTVPTIANGKVYVGGQASVTVYGLLAPPVVATPGVYQGLFFDTNGVSHDSSGFFSVTVARNGHFSGRLRLGKSGFALSGRFSTAGTWSNSIPRRNLIPLTIQLQANGDEMIVGQVGAGAEWTAELEANRNIYSRTDLAPEAGKYTLIIPGASGSASQPGGDSYGRVTVDRTGHIIFAGRLSDGTGISQRTIVSSRGKWPLYASLYSGNGSILGWLTFTNQATNDLAGDASWIKLPIPSARFYRGGFTNETSVVGSSYVFVHGTPILNLNTAEVTVSGGYLAQALANEVMPGSNNRLTGTNHWIVAISAASGLFSGRATNLDGKPISIHGAVLQNQNVASGYFLGSSLSGRVFIGP